jgi:pheromone shutdown protein TraB
MSEIASFSQLTTIQEVNLRGAFMMQSCDLEMALLHIMLFCIVDVEENTVIRKGFKGMMMNEKIKKTIEVLKLYRPNRFIEYESYFDQLNMIKTVRNQMAHCKMLWDKTESDNVAFEFLEISKTANEDEKFDPIKITLNEALEKLSEFRIIILKIADLAAFLKEEFRSKYPGILKPK